VIATNLRWSDENSFGSPVRNETTGQATGAAGPAEDRQWRFWAAWNFIPIGKAEADVVEKGSGYKPSP
jgi:hypothetical protein